MDDSNPVHPAIQALKTICRCNNIKFRTIEKAIREGAYTMTQVATRTTATTGHCGGTCTPDVQQMLDDLVPAHAKPAPVRQASQTTEANANAWWVKK